ncbi:MAG: hypothetical protein P0116_11345 [Candidatus Nitrosocosmicus sp.]|nr:hypothetical protein [Candidatus Nitrosocosmicus sp.]
MNNTNKITLIASITGILTLSIIAMASSLSINQASAQCATALTLGAYPNRGMVAFESNVLPVSLFGDLKCGDSGIAGATIIITGIEGEDKTAVTNNFGGYSSQVRLSPGVYTIEAIYEGDNQNDPSSATRTITANVNPQNSNLAVTDEETTFTGEEEVGSVDDSGN